MSVALFVKPLAIYALGMVSVAWQTDGIWTTVIYESVEYTELGVVPL